MYTQCPDCEVAFKVTAEVLKQAAGKVRCGGCGNAFNALAYLSEQMPQQPIAKDAGAALPELKPEIGATAGGLPQSISAEQSAALLKTLDELAGSDIRIEDTGVEWRVLDDDEVIDTDADADVGTPAINVDDLRFDDNTPLPEDFELADESPEAPEPATEVEDDAFDDELDEPPLDIALSEPGEWADILGEFQELAVEVAAPIEEQADTAEETDDDAEPDEEIASQPLDMDTQFALQAEAMGIDLSGIGTLDDDVVESECEELEDEEPEPEITELEDEEPEPEIAELEDDIGQLDLIDDLDEPQELMVEPVVVNHVIENELESSAQPDSEAGDPADRHYVPPMTEEEHTINMQIDQDLMALAIEDEDGFASTIIIPTENTEKKAHEEEAGQTDDEVDNYVAERVELPGFETIIMEGENIRLAADSEKLAIDMAAAAELVAQEQEPEVEPPPQSGGVRYGLVAGIVALVLLLLIQVMHQSREALATIPAFSSTVGQIYRAIGKPVQPAWDITGWRFEATKGSTEGEAGDLTVYSRLGNNSDGPLPYPLIGISLTDRFEETIGSHMLDPAEYLPTDLDPRKLVEPGNTFNAVITIKATSEEATGFKLNVCYRLSDGKLRCAIDDFK